MPTGYGELLAQQLGTQSASGLLGIGLNLLTQGQQRKQAEALQRIQIEGQKEMGLFNVERQLDLWNRTNAGAQIEHYKKAGLNPALMYEGGGSGGSTAANTGNVGSQSANAIQASAGMNILTAQQARLMEAQARNLDADTAKKSGVDTELGHTTIENLKAQTTNVKAQTSLTKIQTHIAQIQREIAETSQEDITDALSLTAQKLQQEVFQIQNQTDISNATKNTIIQTVKQQYVNTVISGVLMKSGIQLNSATINKMSADIVQRGMEINIKEFEAEIKANNPSIGEVTGNMINSIKGAIERFLGNSEEYKRPNQIK